MTALEILIIAVNYAVLALTLAERIEKITFQRFIALGFIAAMLALKLKLVDHHWFALVVIGLAGSDVAILLIADVIAARRGRRRPTGNILTRLQATYSLGERRRLPDWDRPEFSEVTRELEKQGFHACGDFDEIDSRGTHGPMRAFFDEARTTAAFAHLREDSRKNIQPVAIHFLTELSGHRWVLTDPTPSKRSFASLDRPANVHRLSTSSGWSPSTAAKAHATHVAEVIAAQGGTALVIEDSFDAWCDRRDAYWSEVCAHRKKIGWITEAESMHMFGNDLAYHEVVRLLSKRQSSAE